MSLAAYLPTRRPSVLTASLAQVAESAHATEQAPSRPGPLEERIKKEEAGLIQDRSPLADLLYLRCELTSQASEGADPTGLDGLKLRWARS